MAADHHSNTAQHDSHGASYSALILIWLGLLSLTGITVALAGINLGRWVILTALTIASIKTILVANTFMHLRFETPLFRFFVLAAVITLAIFIGLTFFDYAFY